MKIQSVLEYASPVYYSMLTAQNKDDIEWIQKIFLKLSMVNCIVIIKYYYTWISKTTTSTQVCPGLSEKPSTQAFIQAKNINVLQIEEYQIIWVL